jgi:hypothetical protein
VPKSPTNGIVTRSEGLQIGPATREGHIGSDDQLGGWRGYSFVKAVTPGRRGLLPSVTLPGLIGATPFAYGRLDNDRGLVGKDRPVSGSQRLESR